MFITRKDKVDARNPLQRISDNYANYYIHQLITFNPRKNLSTNCALRTLKKYNWTLRNWNLVAIIKAISTAHTYNNVQPWLWSIEARVRDRERKREGQKNTERVRRRPPRD